MATTATVQRPTTTMVVLALALGAWDCDVAAQSADHEHKALERLFWRCDYATTQGVLDRGSAMECSLTFEALKARKFGGDFKVMLAWWREHKHAEHLAAANELRAVRAPLPSH